MPVRCDICDDTGRYQISHHERGYFVVETYACPCQSEHHLIERKQTPVKSARDVIFVFVVLTLVAILFL